MLYEQFDKDWLTSGVDPRKLAENAVEHDRWDREDWDYIRAEMGLLESKTEDLCDITPTGRPLMEDVFYSLLKATPHRRDAEEMKPSHLPNHLISGQVMDLPEYHELRRSTEGNMFEAAMACTVIEPDVASLADRQKKRQEQAQQLEDKMIDLADARSEEQTLEEMLAELDGDPTEEQSQALQDAQDAVADLTAEVEQLGDEFTKSAAGAMADARRTMQEALDRAADQAHDRISSARAWGVEPAELQKMDVAERFALAKKLDNPRLKEFAEFIGAEMEVMWTEQSRKVDYLREEITDIVQGNDLPQVLTTELLKLADPDREILFLRDYQQRRLLQYELEGTEKLAKGAVIWAQDGSGSMRGKKDKFAASTGICLLNLARKEERTFIGIHFGSRGKFKVMEFRQPSDFTVDRLIEFAEVFYGGGTDFETPLDVALEILQAEFAEDGKVSGDIVLATDGLCDVGTAWFDKFKGEQERLGFQTFGIIFGEPNYPGSTLDRLADGKVCTVRDLTCAEDIRSIFRGIS